MVVLFCISQEQSDSWNILKLPRISGTKKTLKVCCLLPSVRYKSSHWHSLHKHPQSVHPLLWETIAHTYVKQ